MSPISIGWGDSAVYARQALLKLVDVSPGDPAEVVYNKVRNVVEFLRTQEWVEGNYVHGQADGITEYMMRAIAREISNAPRLTIA